tara:strand:- start:331 stop:675 length:345 start_codon:yes stop_codon:yes gene_type:complete
MFPVVFLLSTTAFSQNVKDFSNTRHVPAQQLTVQPKVVKTASKQEKSKDDIAGTFQVFQTNISEEKFLLNKDIIELIKSSRKQGEDTTINFTDGVSVFIPSIDKITNPSFISFK